MDVQCVLERQRWTLGGLSGVGVGGWGMVYVGRSGDGVQEGKRGTT